MLEALNEEWTEGVGMSESVLYSFDKTVLFFVLLSVLLVFFFFFVFDSEEEE
jgi:hypothetical protein